MKTQTLLSQSYKKEILSKFGVNFLIKDNQVFLIKKYPSMSYSILIENDVKFFLESIKNCKKTEFSSFQYPFIPTKNDWKIIKNKSRTVMLHFTTKCNSECNICCVKESLPFKEMTIKEIKKILSGIGRKKIIILFGGEPTTRKDLFKIIDLIKKSDNIPVIHTNGLKLASFNYAKKLKKRGVERVHFSFDGFREDIYEKLRGNKNQLFLKLKALKNLKKLNIEVYLTSVIASGINENEVGKLLIFLIKNNHFIKGLTLLGALPYQGRFNIEIKKILTRSDIIKLLEKASNGMVNREYFIEFRRFRLNIHNILTKIGIFSPFGESSSQVLFKFENGIMPFIPIEELKNINDVIEGKKIIPLIKKIINKRTLLLIKLLLTRGHKLKILGNNVFYISASNGALSIIDFPIRDSPITIIAKNKDEIPFIYRQAD